MIRRLFKNRIVSGLAAIVLIFSFVLAPVSTILEVKRAEAITVFDPSNFAKNTITAIKTAASAAYDAITSASARLLEIKEFSLDVIAWKLVNLVLEEMIESTTRWVNSGFQGSPAFIEDLSGFLEDLADRVAGQIIWESGLAFLCSPFKLDVQLALDIQYRESKRFEAQCRLSDVVDNMEGFFSGDFLAGGWDGWFEMTLTPQNNPYGALLEGQAAIAVGIQNAQGEQLTIANWGRGFLGKEVCDPVCHTVTPGSVIETQLNKTLGLPADRLTIADELDELVGALLGQLTKQIFSEGGSLLGLTDSRYGDGDYFERVSNESRASISSGSSINSMLTQFDSAIKTENLYYNLEQAIVNGVTEASTYKDRTYGDSATCHSGDLTSSLSAHLTSARVNAASGLANYNELIVLKSDYQALQLTGSIATLPASVSTVLAKYGATTIPQALAKITARFTTLQQAATIHTADNITLQNETIPYLFSSTGNTSDGTALPGEITAFTASIDTACRFRTSGTCIPILGRPCP